MPHPWGTQATFHTSPWAGPHGGRSGACVRGGARWAGPHGGGDSRAGALDARQGASEVRAAGRREVRARLAYFWCAD